MKSVDIFKEIPIENQYLFLGCSVYITIFRSALMNQQLIRPTDYVTYVCSLLEGTREYIIYTILLHINSVGLR